MKEDQQGLNVVLIGVESSAMTPVELVELDDKGAVRELLEDHIIWTTLILDNKHAGYRGEHE